MRSAVHISTGFLNRNKTLAASLSTLMISWWHHQTSLILFFFLIPFFNIIPVFIIMPENQKIIVPY